MDFAVKIRTLDFILILMEGQWNILNRTGIYSDLSFKRITLDAVLRMDNGSGEHVRKETRRIVVLTDVCSLNEEGIYKEINGFKIFNEHNNNSQWMDGC